MGYAVENMTFKTDNLYSIQSIMNAIHEFGKKGADDGHISCHDQHKAMGVLLVGHIGMVAGLFISRPYSKFVHAVYRYAALVRNAVEDFHETGI